MPNDRVLDVKDLHFSFDIYSGEVQAVRGVSFHVNRGETLGIVGESGCGKSVTVQSVLKLIPMPPGRLKSGQIIFNHQDITHYSSRQMQHIRGAEAGMIFQDPMTSLNPTMTVGKQITEGLRKHQKMNHRQAIERAIEILTLVGVPNPDKRVTQYPHEFSGGMRQRAMIAISLACNPKLLVADEPTTALDVTIQAQILDLMKDIQSKLGTSIILITHDLGVVANMADRIIVMYAGKVVETGTADDIYYRPQHPYTWGLLQSVPKIDAVHKQQLIPITGTPPDLFSPPIGCAFADRCPHAMKICHAENPEMYHFNNDEHRVSCWLLHSEAPKINRNELGVSVNA
jgi:oligopeptide transport system ATP-binding protein